MRRECVSRNSGTERALGSGIAPTQRLPPLSSFETASNSTGPACMAGALSGSFVCGETPTSLSAPATPQQCPAAAGVLAWSQRVEQHQSARMVCVLRAGAPYAAWTLNAISAATADDMSRFRAT